MTGWVWSLFPSIFFLHGRQGKPIYHTDLAKPGIHWKKIKAVLPFFFARSRPQKPRAWGGWYWVFRRIYQYGQNWFKRFCKIFSRGNGNLIQSLLDYHVCFCEDRFLSFRCSVRASGYVVLTIRIPTKIWVKRILAKTRSKCFGVIELRLKMKLLM